MLRSSVLVMCAALLVLGTSDLARGAAATPEIAQAPAEPRTGETRTLSQKIGELEIVLQLPVITLSSGREGETLASTVSRLTLTNRGSADLRVTVFPSAFSLLDPLGIELYKTNRRQNSSNEMIVSGVQACYNDESDWRSDCLQDPWGTVINPEQSIEVFVHSGSSGGLIMLDKDGAGKASYRPENGIFTGALAIASLDGKTDIRDFSFSNVPLNVVTK